MICPYCQTENKNTARFCNECGAELPTVAPIAQEIFGASDIRLDGGSTYSIDFEGLEKMVDSSNSAHMGSDPNERYADYDPQEMIDTVPFDEDAATTIPVVAGGGYQDRTYYTADDYANTLSFDKTGYADGQSYTTAVIQPVNYSARSGSNYISHEEDDAIGHKRPPKKKRALMVILIILLLAIVAALALAQTYSMQLWGGKVVPDVIRQSEEIATQTLEDDSFVVHVVYVVADDAEGIVLSSDPAPGTRINEGSQVTLNVSIPRVIPEVIGLPKDEAILSLEEAGYVDVEETTTRSDEPEGSVLAIDPEPGTLATSDTHVTLTIAEPFRVPAVVGMSQADAEAALRDAGYAYTIEFRNTEDSPEGTALQTDPAQDTALPSGSNVKLILAHNRSTELISLTRQFFSESKRFNIGGQAYELGEIKSIEYKGQDVCSYVITARPYETHAWFGVEQETRYGNYENIDGLIVYSADNKISSSNPSISKI